MDAAISVVVLVLVGVLVYYHPGMADE